VRIVARQVFHGPRQQPRTRRGFQQQGSIAIPLHLIRPARADRT
jgi:hypothetical protein